MKKIKIFSFFLTFVMLLSIMSNIGLTKAYAKEVYTDESINLDSDSLHDIINQTKNNGFGQLLVNGDDFTILFTDSELLQVLSEPINTNVFRSNGTNGIQGNISSGNFKVFLSATTINAIRTIGIGTISKVIPGLPGWLISSLAAIIGANNAVKHGRVYVYKGFRYQYSYNQ